MSNIQRETIVSKRVETRESNYELLRIVAILFIILYHISMRANWDVDVFSPDGITLNGFFLQSLLPLGKVGVNLFILTSGFFLVSMKKSTWPSLTKIWLTMLFYSLVISSIFAVTGLEEFTPEKVFQAFTPIMSQFWWFASTYVFLLVLSPFVNKMLDACSETDHLKLIILLLIAFCIVPTILGVSYMFSNIAWFLMLYLIGAYISKYRHHFRFRASRYLLFALITYVFILALILILDLNGIVPGYTTNEPVWYMIQMNSITSLLLSLFLFLAFSNADIGRHRVINTIASTMFGVYLIHHHPLVRGYIYSNIFHCGDFTWSPYLPLYVLFVTVVIFSVCAVIEYIRIHTIEAYLFDGINQRFAVLQQRFDGFLSKMISCRK